MEDKFGDNSRLRYPDALSRPNIPSDLFKKEDADFAIKTTGTLLNLVEEFIT
jgi:HEPN domain-containing protein